MSLKAQDTPRAIAERSQAEFSRQRSRPRDEQADERDRAHDFLHEQCHSPEGFATLRRFAAVGALQTLGAPFAHSLLAEVLRDAVVADVWRADMITDLLSGFNDAVRNELRHESPDDVDDDLVLMGTPECARCLLANGFVVAPCNTSHASRTGAIMPPRIHFAIARSDLVLVQVLLEFGADPTQLDFYKWQTALHIAVIHNRPEMVRALLRDPRTIVGVRDITGKIAEDYIYQDNAAVDTRGVAFDCPSKEYLADRAAIIAHFARWRIGRSLLLAQLPGVESPASEMMSNAWLAAYMTGIAMDIDPQH